MAWSMATKKEAAVNRAERRPLRVLESPRLTLVAATRGLIEADLSGSGALSDAIGASVPDEWPPDLFSSTVMRVAAEQLEDPSEQGWSTWYLVHREDGEPVLVGMCQFKGRPDAAGSVEIAYSVLRRYRNRGFATEAVARLVNWAFSHQNVREVAAETMPHRKHSIRIMEKNGFALAGPGSEQGVVRYVLRKKPGR